MTDLAWITPDWPAPNRIRAVITTRSGGVSSGPYASLNLGDHVGDDADAVAENRARLTAALDLPAAPLWLKQIHGCTVARAEQNGGNCVADAIFAQTPGQVCAVLTADCLPILLCDQAGSRVAAIHAGWRGLVEGVIESALSALDIPGPEVLAWLGPAIGPAAFEVGDEVRTAFVARNPGAASAFQSSLNGRWQADLYALARQRLNSKMVGYIGGGEYCTVTNPTRFFSYRRDGVTGRMASLIWID
jgi:polyphenol oxidase